MPTRLTLGHVYRPICPQSSGDQAPGEVSAVSVLDNGSSLGHSVSKRVQKPAVFFGNWQKYFLKMKQNRAWSMLLSSEGGGLSHRMQIEGLKMFAGCLQVQHSEVVFAVAREIWESVQCFKIWKLFKTMQRHSSREPIHHSSICKKSRHLGLYMSISKTVFKTAVLNAFRASSPIPSPPPALGVTFPTMTKPHRGVLGPHIPCHVSVPVQGGSGKGCLLAIYSLNI